MAKELRDVDVKTIVCRVPVETPIDIVQALKDKKKTSANFSAEILRLLTVAIRLEKDPRTIAFPMPEELPGNVLAWVNDETNKQMLGRFVYAALTGIQAELGVMPKGNSEPMENETAAKKAMQNAALSFLNDDD